MKQEVIQCWVEVYKDDSVIYSTPRTFYQKDQFPGVPDDFTFRLNQNGDYTEIEYRDIVPNIRCQAMRRTYHVDKEAMEAKIVELENMLAEFGAKLNGSKHKYDAHLLSISSEKFTTIQEDPVEVIAYVKHCIVKTEK